MRGMTLFWSMRTRSSRHRCPSKSMRSMPSPCRAISRTSEKPSSPAGRARWRSSASVMSTMSWLQHLLSVF